MQDIIDTPWKQPDYHAFGEVAQPSSLVSRTCSESWWASAVGNSLGIDGLLVIQSSTVRGSYVQWDVWSGMDRVASCAAGFVERGDDRTFVVVWLVIAPEWRSTVASKGDPAIELIAWLPVEPASSDAISVAA
jgi:hypothetical protein